jgi:holo-[acyl-carrier protein] synthase
MIAGIGIDLIEVKKIARSISSEMYLRKVFTEAEIAECRLATNSAERFAGKFAAKEALMKAIGKGIRQGVWFTQIEVLNEASGAPYIRVNSEVETSLNELGVKKIHISITHTKSNAAAIVILEQSNGEK